MKNKVKAIGNYNIVLKNGIKREDYEDWWKSAFKGCAKRLNAKLIYSEPVTSPDIAYVSKDEAKRMLQLCKSDRRIKYIIFDKTERFSKSLSWFYKFFRRLQKLGVGLVFASDPFLDTSRVSAIFEYFEQKAASEDKKVEDDNNGQAD